MDVRGRETITSLVENVYFPVVHAQRSISAAAFVALGFVAACRTSQPDLQLNQAFGTPPVTSTSSSSAPRPTWPRLEAMRSFAKANGRRFSSAGHFFGRYDADIVVSNYALAAYRAIGPGRSLPVGAIVAKVHHVAGAEDAGPILAMEKLASGWSYVELDAEGRLIREGRLEPCLGCHTQVASQDELFGVPTTGR